MPVFPAARARRLTKKGQGRPPWPFVRRGRSAFPAMRFPRFTRALWVPPMNGLTEDGTEDSTEGGGEGVRQNFSRQN